MARHASVIKNSLWNLDPAAPLVYLNLAAERDYYSKVTIHGLKGGTFLTIDGPVLTGADKFFDLLKLIPKGNVSSDIVYEGRVIGNFKAEYYNKSIYTYLYALILLLFIYLAISLFIKTVQDKHQLEDRVQERTAELMFEIEVRERAEHERERFESVINNTTDMVSMAKSDSTILFLNSSGFDMLGIDRNEDVADFKIGDLHPDWAYELVSKQGVPAAIRFGFWVGETALLHRDGSEIPVSQVILSHKDKNGEIDYLSTIIRDITERKNAEKKLRDREENLRITLDSIGDAVIATDADGIISRMNPVAEKLTGWKLSDAAGRHLQEVFKIIDMHTKVAAESPVNEVLRTGQVVELANHTVLITKTGKECHIADSGAPIKNPEGEIVGVVLVFRDITEQYRMEEQLRQTQKMDSIGQLAGGIAHDFNNMLCGIMGMTELLDQQVKGNDKAVKFVKTIFQTASRAAELTSKLLAFGRKGQNVSILLDIEQTLNEAVSILQHSLDKRIDIEKKSNTANRVVSGDPSQLLNVFINLGVNAGDAMPDGGKLIIETSNVDLDEDFCESASFDLVPGEYVQISVQDHGCGMPAEVVSRVFEPFFTTKRQGKGTGLGMAAVYGTVKQHHGDINIFSREGEGTAVHVFLPVKKTRKPSSGIHHEDDYTSGSGTILVIDDEEVIRNSVSELLQDMGYNVVSAADGEDGLKLYKDNTRIIDLILLDMVMPKMSGSEVFEAIREIKSDAKVIIASGFTSDERISKLQKAGLADFMKKPFRRNELSRVVARALGERKDEV
jgi:PAS domain S-box-containing protein